MVVVPPGHRVVVIHPSQDPFFAPSESGPMMLNFGSVEHVPSGLTKVAEWAGSTKEQQSVLWLMPANILPAFDNAPVLLAQIAKLVTAAPHVSHLAVFPGSSPLLDRVMESFRSIGVNTQRGAPDGACYVEVHKPDGSIVVGIPGPDSPANETEQGSELDALITDIADHNREDDLSKLMSQLPTLRLSISVVGSLPENLSPGGSITLDKSLHLNCLMGSVQGLKCLVVFTSSTHPRLDPEHTLIIDGLSALQMVVNSNSDGLLIQSARTAWVIIQRGQIEQILSQRSGSR